MKRGNKTERTRLRIRLMLGLFLAFQVGILTYLWNLQVVQGHTYRETISRQSLRRIRHPGARGRILDRKGFVLADNRPSVGIALYMEELRVPGPATLTLDRIEEKLDEMAEQLEIPRTLSRDQIETHYREQRLLPLMAWTDLNEAAVARWAERIGPQQGIDLLTESVREYPRDDLFAQTLGYVGRGGAATEEEDPYDFYLPEMEGKAGLESVFDPVLRGEAGGELVRIDVAMYKYEVEAEKPSVSGKDVLLTLDARVQWLAERVLDGAIGSIVVMDPRNGEVLAMATNPRYDLNDFIPRISHSVWNNLLEDPRRPLVNRPVREHYPPGSIIKPFVCLGAVLYGGIDPNTVYRCDGRYSPAPGATPMHCHNRFGHGDLNMREALERSCNDYMWQLVEQTGYAPIYKLLYEITLGLETGVEVDYEVPGILPTDAWKKARYNDILRTGDIANLAIGQGFLTVTPIQMARVTSALAMGGVLPSPTLIQGFRDPVSGTVEKVNNQPSPLNLGWDSSAVEAVREGMRDVVMNPRGTAHRTAYLPGLTYAGKTGTAQFGPRGNRRYRSWMIAFAPYDNPRIAAVVLVDEGRGSGVDAAPRMKLLMKALFGGRMGE